MRRRVCYLVYKGLPLLICLARASRTLCHSPFSSPHSVVVDTADIQHFHWPWSAITFGNRLDLKLP